MHCFYLLLCENVFLGVYLIIVFFFNGVLFSIFGAMLKTNLCFTMGQKKLSIHPSIIYF